MSFGDKRVVQIVARLPPHVDGVGDYAVQLAGALGHYHGVATSFAECRAGQGSVRADSSEFGRFSVERETAESVEGVLSAATDSAKSGESVPLVFHYVGYGYDPTGAPDWLIQGIEKFLAHRPTPLITIFHELFATAPPWRRAFWHSFSQRALAKQLFSISDGLVCTTQKGEVILRSWLPAKRPLVRLPVPSNIGEPEKKEIPLWDSRHPNLIVFGRAESRARIYNNVSTLNGICQSLNVRKVIDIGPPCVIPGLRDVETVSLGVLPAVKISKLLMQARFGCLYYPGAYLAKSGIFAAYSAHCLATVAMAGSEQNYDGLVKGQHYLVAGEISPKLDIGAVAKSAFDWYQGHNVASHAAVLWKMLFRVDAV
jgi:hypothetical protein